MSFKSLVRSTLLIGSSSAASTLVGILRVKALALLVGPAGVGLLGVLAAVTSAGTTLAALGSDTSGTRRIALDQEDVTEVARVRRTLVLVAVLHGLVASTVVWLCREPLAFWLLGSTAYATELGLSGVAIALSLAAGLRIAQMQGLGRVREITTINLTATFAGTAIGLAAVWAWGLPGLVVVVLAQPAIAALIASLLDTDARAARQPRRHSAVEDLKDWWAIVSLGAPYMVSFLVTALTPLAIRALVSHDLGIEAAGHFHAAWTLSVIYVAFLLNAMSVDYFPRLAGTKDDRASVQRLVNDQTQLALSLGGVVLLGVLATAPLLVPMLYSKAFAPTIAIVEWQALGNLLKIAGWPIGYLLMAHGRARLLIATELAWNGVLIAAVWLGLPHLGVEATGVAFAVASVAFLIIHLSVGCAVFGVKLDRATLGLLLAFAGAGLVTFAAARHSPALQFMTGGLLTASLGLASLRLIVFKVGGNGRTATRIRRAFARAGWPLPSSLLSTQRG